MTELYLFDNNGALRGFTPELYEITFDNHTYAPTIVTRSVLTLTGNFEKSDVTFQFGRDHNYAKDLLQFIPEKTIKVTIYKNSAVYWWGEVKEVNASGTTISLVCNSSGSNLNRNVQRGRLTLECYKRLYSPACGVVKNLHGADYTVTAASSSIFISGFTAPAGTYSGGIAEMDNQVRQIVNQTATNIFITHPFSRVITGTITIFPGCALTEAACTAFGNLPNGGMFARIPMKNPFKANGLL